MVPMLSEVVALSNIVFARRVASDGGPYLVVYSEVWPIGPNVRSWCWPNCRSEAYRSDGTIPKKTPRLCPLAQSCLRSTRHRHCLHHCEVTICKNVTARVCASVFFNQDKLNYGLVERTIRTIQYSLYLCFLSLLPVSLYIEELAIRGHISQKIFKKLLCRLCTFAGMCRCECVWKGKAIRRLEFLVGKCPCEKANLDFRKRSVHIQKVYVSGVRIKITFSFAFIYINYGFYKYTWYWMHLELLEVKLCTRTLVHYEPFVASV